MCVPMFPNSKFLNRKQGWVSKLLHFDQKGVALGTGALIALSATLSFRASAESVSWRKDLQECTEKGVHFLQSKQQTNGAWLPDNQPAVSALVLGACAGEPSGKVRKQQ